MAPHNGGRVFPSEVISNILGRLDAAGVACGQSVCAKWHKAARHVKSLRFTEETFPEGMAPEAALTLMTRMIMQATELEHLDITYVSTAGLPDSLLTAWFLSLRPTLVSLNTASIYSYEQTLQGVRHPTIARHVSTHFQRSPLRHLALSGAELAADVAPLPLLETLQLSDVSTTSAALRTFVSGCVGLVSLTLADLDGLRHVDLKSSSLQHVTVSGEMNSVSFALSLDCPNLRTLSVRSIRLDSMRIGNASKLESIKLEDVSEGPIRFQHVGSSLRSVHLKGVTWQHVGAVMSAAQGKKLTTLEIEGVTGRDAWTMDDDSEEDSHQVSPASSPRRKPMDVDVLSDTEEAFDVQSRPKIPSVQRALPAIIASFQTLQTLALGAEIWELIQRESHKFPQLRNFEMSGAPIGSKLVHSIERMVITCPMLQRVTLCGELGRTQHVPLPPPLVSSGSRTSIESADSVSADSSSAEALDGYEVSSPTKKLRFSQKAFSEVPPRQESMLSQNDVSAFSTKFAAQAMALQRKYSKLLVNVQFRNSSPVEE